MNATLIKLETKVVAVPDHRPFFRELVREGFEPLEANYEGMEATYIPRDIKTVDYRLVEIRGGKNGENGTYMVNDDMWHVAVPILEDIIQRRLRPVEKENVDLRVEVAYLSNTLKKIQTKWWYRLFTKIKSMLPSLPQELSNKQDK